MGWNRGLSSVGWWRERCDRRREARRKWVEARRGNGEEENGKGEKMRGRGWWHHGKGAKRDRRDLECWNRGKEVEELWGDEGGRERREEKGVGVLET